jgi:hypothetical protein
MVGDELLRDDPDLHIAVTGMTMQAVRPVPQIPCFESYPRRYGSIQPVIVDV